MKRSLFLILAISLFASASFGQEVLFFDDFEGGMDPEWMPNGGWAVQNGRLVNLTTCGFQTCMPDIWAGSESQSDYMVSFELTLLEPSPSSYGFSLQVWAMFAHPCEPQECPSISGYGYRADVGWNDAGSLVRYDGGAWDEFQIIEETLSGCAWTSGVLYRVYFGKQGGNLIFGRIVDGQSFPEFELIVPDSTYRQGHWGISFWNGIVAIDNFRVEGLGVVATDETSFGSLKALYR